MTKTTTKTTTARAPGGLSARERLARLQANGTGGDFPVPRNASQFGALFKREFSKHHDHFLPEFTRKELHWFAVMRKRVNDDLVLVSAIRWATANWEVFRELVRAYADSPRADALPPVPTVKTLMMSIGVAVNGARGETPAGSTGGKLLGTSGKFKLKELG